MHFSDVECGKQLIIGTGTYYDCLGLGRNAIRGSAYIEGPFLVGDAKSFTEVVATTMIARDVNVESKNPPRSLHVKGDIKTEGDGTNPAHVLISGTSNADALVVEGDQTINSGNLHDSNLLNCTGQNVALTGSTINTQGWKGFDIVHPSKKGYRLRHICVEGPEDGPIYVRGKLEGNLLELPDYWDGLVDKESISVHLTPIGSYQELFVEKIEWGKNVHIKNASGGPVKCYYQVWAARQFEEKLHVEYEGDTPADYPGDNSHFSIAGYDYDRR